MARRYLLKKVGHRKQLRNRMHLCWPSLVRFVSAGRIRSRGDPSDSSKMFMNRHVSANV